MIIEIRIETESINEFYDHLTQIRKGIKKEAKRQKINPFKDQFKSQEWEDDSCYGSHTVSITEE